MAAQQHATARGPSNLAARMGRWSASHRKAAIFGWLAFVVSAFVLGGLVGTKQLSDAAAQPGEAGQAAQIFARAGFDAGDPESVLVQSETLKAADPAFAGAVHDVERALRRLGGIDRLRRHVSKDGHSAVIQFRLMTNVDRALAAVQRVAEQHPGVHDRRVRRRQCEQGDGRHRRA